MLSGNLGILSKVSVSKSIAGLGMLGSYAKSRYLESFHAPPLPISIAFEPTTSCNLRCPECPSGLRSFTRPTGMLDPHFFKEQIDQMHRHLIYLTFYFQGEPYLHPQFLDMVSHASKRRIFTSTSTNAHYLDDDKAEATVRSGLDRLIISIDGTTQETYEQYRIGGRLEKVLDGTRNLVKWKRRNKSKSPQLIFQFLVVRPNEHQIEEAKKLASEIGVDKIEFKTAQIYDYEEGSPLIPLNSKYSRYTKIPHHGAAGNESSKYRLKNPLHDHCWKMWHSCVVTWDGKVVPCCFDKDAKYVMGNLQDKSLNEIWHSNKYNAFRKAILKSRSEIDICQNCSEGMDLRLVE